MQLKEDIQIKWRRQGPPPTKDLSLSGLSAYKYDVLGADNAYIGFFFLRVSYCMHFIMVIVTVAFCRYVLAMIPICMPELVSLEQIIAPRT